MQKAYTKSSENVIPKRMIDRESQEIIFYLKCYYCEPKRKCYQGVCYIRKYFTSSMTIHHLKDMLQRMNAIFLQKTTFDQFKKYHLINNYHRTLYAIIKNIFLM